MQAKPWAVSSPPLLTPLRLCSLSFLSPLFSVPQILTSNLYTFFTLSSQQLFSLAWGKSSMFTGSFCTIHALAWMQPGFHVHLTEIALTHWKRLWCWEGLGAGGEGDDRGWGGWMASLTQWTWVWVNSRSWWWTGRPGMLWFMGSQRVGHDWATELNWTHLLIYSSFQASLSTNLLDLCCICSPRTLSFSKSLFPWLLFHASEHTFSFFPRAPFSSADPVGGFSCLISFSSQANGLPGWFYPPTSFLSSLLHGWLSSLNFQPRLLF